MKKLAATLGLIAFTVAGVARADGLVSNVTVTGVEADWTSGGTTSYIYYSGGTGGSNKPACATAPYSLLWGAPDHVKSMTSLATAALLAGRPLSISFEGCSGTAGKIIHMQLK